MEDPGKKIDISVDLDTHVHFARQQNDVPVIKALRVKNRTDAPLRDLEILIVAEPSFGDYHTQDVVLRNFCGLPNLLRSYKSLSIHSGIFTYLP
jgi:hypothetical protein